MPEELGSLYYWGTQGNYTGAVTLSYGLANNMLTVRELAPLRATLAFFLVIYTWGFGPSSPLYGGAGHRTRGGYNPSYLAAGWGGDTLKNRVFFTFVFIEMLAWFWVWVTLREERQGVVERMRMRQGRANTSRREHDE